MAKKESKKADDVNQKIVEELLSKGDPSQLFGKDGLFNDAPRSRATRYLPKKLQLFLLKCFVGRLA